MNFQYETERLILKILPASDAKEVLRFQLDNRQVFEKYDGEKPDSYYTLPFQQKAMEFDFGMTIQQRAFRYWIAEKKCPQQIIGTVSIQRIERGIFQTCTIGYKMDPLYQRQGYMYEALSTLIPLIFSDLKLHRIEAFVRPDNTPSICLLEKCCFFLEGTAYQSIYINGAWEDHLRFALVSSPECQT